MHFLWKRLKVACLEVRLDSGEVFHVACGCPFSLAQLPVEGQSPFSGHFLPPPPPWTPISNTFTPLPPRVCRSVFRGADFKPGQIEGLSSRDEDLPSNAWAMLNWPRGTHASSSVLLAWPWWGPAPTELCPKAASGFYFLQLIYQFLTDRVFSLTFA